MKKPLLVLATLVAVAFAFSACGSSDEGAEAVSADSTAPAESTFNDADVTFAQGMIPHHSQAIEMATMAIEQGNDPTVLNLASRIKGAQDPEIEQMRSWLTLWGQEEMAADMEGMDMGSAEGMMDDTEMSALSEATGTAFDALFVDMMIRHHQGAITMAKIVLADGADPEVRALAEEIISAQEGEITEMLALEAG